MSTAPRLLLVDRDPAIVTTYRAFRDLGYETVVARTLDAAVELAYQHRPHVIVMEWSPRYGSGPGAAGLLREVLPEGVVIVAFSVLDEPEGFRTQEQIDEYFVKPTPVSEIASRIEELLQTV